MLSNENKALEDTTDALKKSFQESAVKTYKITKNQNIKVFMSDSNIWFLGGSNQGDEKDFNKIIDIND